MRIYNIKQGTEEWLKIRLGKFTGSDGQAVATNGKGLDTLVYKKVAEIITGAIPESYTNADIERGNELEDEARSFYEIVTGNKVDQIGFAELTEFVGCSPDGLVEDNKGVEIKCTNDYKFVEYMYTKKVDTKHMWQMQFNMYVTNRDSWDYVVYNQNFEKNIIIQEIKKDEAKIEKIKIGLETGVAKLKLILDELAKTK